ncbi:MAG: efflux RND transporter periplasmic adaptor subunit [Armatimonadota bacterium]
MSEERDVGSEAKADDQSRADEERQRKRNAKKNRGRLKWLWLLPIIALAAYLIWRWQQPPEVEVVRPQKRQIVQTLSASGRVQGARAVQLSADRTGIVVDLLVNEGDVVEAGEAVARISSEVESAELRQAEAAIATARANLSEARANASTLPPTIRQAEAESHGAIEQARERLSSAEVRLEELLAGGREQEVREAEAAVNEARARVDQAETDVERARSLATSDATARAALERAQASQRDAAARLQEASARLAQAERDLTRARRLYDEGVMAEADYESARTAAETAAETVQQARAGLRQAEVEVANQRTLLEVTREEQLDRAQTALETAREQLQRTRARLDLVSSPARAEQITQQRAEIRSARAALQQATEAGPARVESIRRTPAQERVAVADRRLTESIAARDAVLTRLEKTSVAARFGGIITDIVREPGDVVTPGQPIITISEMERPEIRIEIDERDIAEVDAGQDAYLTADAHPEETIEAVVERITPEAITERGVIDVILRPLSRPAWLRQGMTVDASIVVAEEQELLVLPTGSVVLSGEDASVLVVDDGEIRRLQVEIGVGGVRGTVIRSGLSEDALVVRESASVRVGQEVEPVETEASPETSADV